ncbi:DUF4870 domain-containing protein [Stenotrophomonas sp. ATCM1_4]|jgi:uncharacterized Tic20 family protein|uniref:DUF4870 domain-containing protein n=1 Tax=Stenotrophomonas capsici TaxID=3110230 RepID=A0ABU5UZH3_9GAMM|nr:MULTISPECIES: DUF4870 domain-containing protein [unclassified Stenotrophomonas]MBD9534795.1 DUF4870 domain-containing protein [Stenotrophomonas sp. STM01]MEA5666484.1 DUF4870 domain-containing protein [Stenotrophomonas sp. MH1]TDB27989.1 DUF4870 domain-containing protein [Stenotrophomonas sp. ATCM1_4]
MSDYQNTTPPPAPAGNSSSDDNTIAMLVHLSGIILSFIVPLIIWLVNKDNQDKKFLSDNAKEALNFQITLIGVYIIGTILTIILIGALINFAAWIACIVFSIIAGLAANKGQTYRYPMTIRLIK